MDIVYLNSVFEEKGIVLTATADLTTAPRLEDDKIFLKFDADNSEKMNIGDFVAVEGTDFGGKITDLKVDYGNDTVEFSGFGWWQYFNNIFVTETAIVNKTLAEAVTLVFTNSQFDYFEVEDDGGSETFTLPEPLGVTQSLAECLTDLENLSGKTIKFRYAENKLKIIIGESALYDGFNVSNTDMTVEVKSFLPDYYVLIGDKTKPQYEEQEPSGTQGGEDIYPQTILFYDCEAEEAVPALDTTKIIKLLNCSENAEADMLVTASEKYAEELASAYGISGKLSDELSEAEVKDVISFYDENFGFSFTRKIEKKIYQKTETEETVEFELGDISYL